MLALHGATGERRYLDFVVRTRALPQWDLGIVIGRREGIEGHVYAYMARCLAQLELYRTQPDAGFWTPRKAIDFLTEGNGLAISGGAGQWEIWTADQDAAANWARPVPRPISFASTTACCGWTATRAWAT